MAWKYYIRQKVYFVMLKDPIYSEEVMATNTYSP